MSAVITIHLDGESREFDLASLLISEARDMKRLIGYSDMRVFLDALDDKDPDAAAFAWWLVNKRAGTPLEGKFADLDFNLQGMTFSVPARDDVEPAPEEGAEDDTPTSSDEGQESPTS